MIQAKRYLALVVAITTTLGASMSVLAGEKQSDVDRPGRFEHLVTGFALEGAHIDAACETCHARQIFQGTPRTCSTCHLLGGPIAVTTKPVLHIPTREECSDCHDQIAWTGAIFVHGPSTIGRCTSCHNGVSATGKPATHIPTSSQCDVCHRPQAWLPVNLGSALGGPASRDRELLGR